MSFLTKNIIGWGLMGIGWVLQYLHYPVFAIPFFGVAIIIFVLVLVDVYKGQ